MNEKCCLERFRAITYFLAYKKYCTPLISLFCSLNIFTVFAKNRHATILNTEHIDFWGLHSKMMKNELWRYWRTSKLPHLEVTLFPNNLLLEIMTMLLLGNLVFSWFSVFFSIFTFVTDMCDWMSLLMWCCLSICSSIINIIIII